MVPARVEIAKRSSGGVVLPGHTLGSAAGTDNRSDIIEFAADRPGGTGPITIRAGRFPAGWPGTRSWWRRGDSTFRGFRCGLDYAFIRDAQLSARMRSVLSGWSKSFRILVLAPGKAFGESMSLYRAGLKLAFFLPLGVAMPLPCESAVRFHRCELRFQSLLTE